MYNPFFGLVSNPFSNTIPPDDYDYLPFNHRIILQTLTKGLYKSRGVLLITGASGVGKSTFLNAFLENYDENNKVVFKDLSPHKHPQFLESNPTEMILTPFFDESLAEIGDKAAVVFFLDGTENLTHSFLKILLGKVSECNRNNKPVLLILTGQPKFEAEIKHLLSELSIPLAINSFFLRSLDARQVKNYIKHHLFSAGCSTDTGHIFSDEAIQLITQLSKGIPRTINTLCNLSIFEASLKGLRVIDEEIVNHASESLPLTEDTSARKEALIPAALDAIETQPLDSGADKYLNQIKTVPTILADELGEEITKGFGLNAINKTAINDNQKAPEAESDSPHPSGEQAKSKDTSLLNNADNLVSKDTIYNYPFKLGFYKWVKELAPLMFFLALLIWISYQDTRLAKNSTKNLTKIHPDIIKSPFSADFTALLAENKIEINRYQALDEIIERLNKPSNKSIAFSIFHKEFKLLQAKRKKHGEEHLVAKLKIQPLLPKTDAPLFPEIKQADIPDKILVTKEITPNNQRPIPYWLLPKGENYPADSDDMEFLNHFFGGKIPINSNRKLFYETEAITSIDLNPLSITVLSKGQLTPGSQDNQAKAAQRINVH